MESSIIKNKLVSILKQKGRGTLDLKNAFMKYDKKQGNSDLSYEEFLTVLNNYGLYPTSAESRSLFLELDTDNDGVVSYIEFLKIMRGELSQRRKDIITKLFNSIDRDGDGRITMTDIGSSFNPKNHPDVKSGLTTIPNLLKDFISTFNTVTDNGYISLSQFLEYYSNSAAYDDDASFEAMISSLWNISTAKANFGGKPKSLNEIMSSQSTSSSDIVAPAGLEKLRQELISRGSSGIIGIQRKFRIIDDDNSKSLNLVEFKKALKESNVNLSDSEVSQLFNYFDTNKNGLIEFDEFIVAVRGPMNSRRKQLVLMAFDVIDKDCNGVLEPADLVSCYDTSKHPEVLAGRKTPDQVLREFLDTFDVGGEIDGKVTRQEFINYYTNLGASIDNEDYFELMIRNAWHISGGEGAAANSANRRVLVTGADGSQSVTEIKNDLGLKANDKAGMIARLKAQGVDASNISLYDGGDDNNNPGVEGLRTLRRQPIKPRDNTSGVLPGGTETVFSTSRATKNQPFTLEKASAGVLALVKKLKEQLKANGGHGFIALQRKFRILDDDGSKNLDVSEFKKGMKELKLTLTDPELRTLFEYFDSNKNGSIDFEEFVQGVRDPLTSRRLALVELAFKVLDTNGDGVIDVSEVASKYDASKHPDVLAGRKTPDQVYREFLDTFDVGGEIDGKVTRQEFINYYTNLGASIDNEDYFELMIRNAWHISGGEGAAANSANRRVLVTGADGSQSVTEIKNDLGLKANDKAGMIARLKAQGVDASNISLYDGGDDNKNMSEPINAFAKKQRNLSLVTTFSFGQEVPKSSQYSTTLRDAGAVHSSIDFAKRAKNQSLVTTFQFSQDDSSRSAKATSLRTSNTDKSIGQYS